MKSIGYLCTGNRTRNISYFAQIAQEKPVFGGKAKVTAGFGLYIAAILAAIFKNVDDLRVEFF